MAGRSKSPWVSCCQTESSKIMTNKRHAAPPRAPSLDPDTGEPVQNVAPAEGATAAPDVPPGAAGPAPAVAPAPTADQSEVEAWKDRHLRLAAEYDNFRKRTAKERAEVWGRAQAELVSRLADALDDLSRFAHIDPAVIDSKTLHEGSTWSSAKSGRNSRLRVSHGSIRSVCRSIPTCMRRSRPSLPRNRSRITP